MFSFGIRIRENNDRGIYFSFQITVLLTGSCLFSTLNGIISSKIYNVWHFEIVYDCKFASTFLFTLKKTVSLKTEVDDMMLVVFLSLSLVVILYGQISNCLLVR